MGISQQLAASRLIQPGVCTSSTRPASPYEGQCIYETDTDKMLIYDGSAWYPPKNTAWGVLGRHELTTAFSTSSPHTTYQDEGLSVSVTYGPNRLLRATLLIRPYTNGGTNFVLYKVLRGSTAVTSWGFGLPDISNGEAPNKTVSYVFAGPSTAGTETFKVQICGTPNNTQVTSYGQPTTSDGPRQLVIEDIGPA